jgi:hypothetical protein
MKPVRTGLVAAMLGAVKSGGLAWGQPQPAALARDATEEKKEKSR